MFNWKSPAFIAADLERPVPEVWALIKSLELKPAALINGTAHFDTRAVSAIEEVFESQEKSDD